MTTRLPAGANAAWARRRQRWRAFATVLTLALGAGVVVTMSGCETPTASRPEAAFNPTALTNGLLYRWKSGTTVRVWIVPSTSSISSLDLGFATRQAMDRWNHVAGFKEYVLKSATRIDEAEIIVYDGAVSALPVTEGTCGFNPRGSAGYTYFCPGTSAGGTALRAELLWLSQQGPGLATVIIRLDKGRVSTQSAYNAIVAHEFGHALGIGGHSDVPTDVMFGLPTSETPSERDRATLRWLLGKQAALLL